MKHKCTAPFVHLCARPFTEITFWQCRMSDDQHHEQGNEQIVKTIILQVRKLRF